MGQRTNHSHSFEKSSHIFPSRKIFLLFVTADVNHYIAGSFLFINPLDILKIKSTGNYFKVLGN